MNNSTCEKEKICVGATVSRDTHAKLKAMADASEIYSISDLIRLAIKEYLAKNEKQTEA